MEELQVAETKYRLFLLFQYEKDLKALKRLEPKLHEEVRNSIKTEIGSEKLDEIKGTGGWIKGRAGSPSRNIGKSGGFRFLYLFFRMQNDIYLFSVYDHRKKMNLTQEEIKELRILVEIIKKFYRGGGS
jgi:hypothetical protein